MLSLRFSDDHRDRQPLLFSYTPFAPTKETVNETIEIQEDRVIPNGQPLNYSLLGITDVPIELIFIEAGSLAVWYLMQSAQEDQQAIMDIIDAKAALEMIYGVYASHLPKNPITFH